jgi:Sec-independent protein translocase protein TatA
MDRSSLLAQSNISRRRDVPDEVKRLVQQLRKELREAQRKIVGLEKENNSTNKKHNKDEQLLRKELQEAQHKIVRLEKENNEYKENENVPSRDHNEKKVASSTSSPSRTSRATATMTTTTTTTTTSTPDNQKASLSSSSSRNSTVVEKSPQPPRTNPNDKPWEEHIEELKHFIAGNGHARVPRKIGDLAYWVDRVRQSYRHYNLELEQENNNNSNSNNNNEKDVQQQQQQKEVKNSIDLNEERIQLLNSLNFEWRVAPMTKSWEERIQELEAYKAEHGDLLVKSRDPLLGVFVHTLRRKRKEDKLSQEKVQQLSESEWWCLLVSCLSCLLRSVFPHISSL